MLIHSIIHIKIANLSSPHIPQEEGLTRQWHPWRRTNLRLQEEEEWELPKPPAMSGPTPLGKTILHRGR